MLAMYYFILILFPVWLVWCDWKDSCHMTDQEVTGSIPVSHQFFFVVETQFNANLWDTNPWRYFVTLPPVPTPLLSPNQLPGISFEELTLSVFLVTHVGHLVRPCRACLETITRHFSFAIVIKKQRNKHLTNLFFLRIFLSKFFCI